MYNATFHGIPGTFRTKYAGIRGENPPIHTWRGSFSYFSQDGESIAFHLAQGLRGTPEDMANPRNIDDFYQLPIAFTPIEILPNAIARHISYEEFRNGYGLHLKENTELITLILANAVPGMECEYVEMAFAEWEPEFASYCTEQNYQNLARRAASWWLHNCTDATEPRLVEALEKAIVSRLLKDDMVFLSNSVPRSGSAPSSLDVGSLVSVPITSTASMWITPYSISGCRGDRPSFVPSMQVIYQVPLNLGVKSRVAVS